MGTYFIRRLLLVIPTFLGSTIMVFTILQMAPGGPLEQVVRQLQSGGAGYGETAGKSLDTGGTLITEEAMEELKRFYGFDQPIIIRYLIWLGVDPAFQKQGVGEKLYLRFQDLMIAEGVRMLMMDTSANDIAALKFFKKLGFNQPHEQIYMTLNLDNHRKSKSRKTKPAK